MRPRTCAALLLTAITALVFGGEKQAFADDDLDGEEVATYAVQSRKFRLGGEIAPAVGILPVDAFNKGLTVGGALTYHLSTVWAWEVAQGAYVFKNLDTGLKKELLENFAVEPTQISSIDYLVSSNLVFKPFYGKLAVVNKSVSHVEVFLPLGIALGKYSNPATYRQGLDVGLGVRWFWGTHTSLRIDVRDYMLFKGFKSFSPNNELLVALGLAVAFGGDER